MDARSGAFFDLYLQRLTAAGAIAPGWTPKGIRVCPTPGYQDAPKLVADGAGGVFVVWEDYRRNLSLDPNGQADIYAQRILPDGTMAAGWPTEGLPVCTAPGDRGASNGLTDGAGGLFVEWADARSADSTGADIYAQRLTAEGAIAPGWALDGVPICTAPGHQNIAALAPDGQDGFLVAWQDLRSAPPYNEFDEYSTDIYASRVTGSGSVVPGWSADGMPVCTAPGLQQQQTMVSDGAGGAIVVWSDYRNYDLSASDLYAQRILPSGKIAPGWPVDGVALSRAPYWQVGPAAVADGAGGALVAYETTLHGDNLYVQHVTEAGTLAPGWAADDGNPLCVVPGIHEQAAAVSDGSGGMIVAWQDERDSAYQIYAQHVAGDTPTAALVSLVATQAEPGRVVLTWFAAEPLSALVYRRSERSDWMSLGAPRRVGDGLLVFEDQSVSEGRYAYRLGYAGGAGERFTPDAWVTVPAGHVLALAGFHPNPTVGDPVVSLSLATAQPARLEVFDASGRALLVREVGSLGPGSHVIQLGQETRWAPGVYWLRLTQERRSLTARGLVLR